MANRKCYLCQSRKIRSRSGSVRDNPSLKILECGSCGLVFLSSFDHINRGFYENSGMHAGETLDIKTWIRETEWDDERRFQFSKSFLPNRVLLDFGCGTGNFLVKAKTLADEVYGVEPETRLANHFKQLDLTVYRCISEIPRSSRYDIITLFHVIEHLTEPMAALTRLSRLLKKAGQIIIEVPNADDALLTLYNSRAFSNFTYWSCHLFLFNNKTLGTLAIQAGLKINYIKQIQRYTLANHLFWLSKGKPAGHQQWSFLDSKELHTACESRLAALGKCDTILASFSV
jgi:2-polyprenyl-3-methyl-5-hydroxy-6-metoxy-1,4-benzoquinol methylase